MEKTEAMLAAEELYNSSEVLLRACELCKKDPIRQDMLKVFHEDFNRLAAREAGLNLLLEKKSVDEIRNFLTEEMKDIARNNRELASKIRQKLEGLDESN